MTDMKEKALEQVLIGGDLEKLSTEERLSYYRAVCESLGLNPLTQPFEYIRLNGKLRLYARRDATEQLRKLYGVSVSGMHFETINDVYIVRADFIDKNGRTDQSTGAVPIKGLTGDNLANAMMKAETKCKRRGTLSICGLGMLDETEAETIIDPTAAAQKKFKSLKPKPAVTAEPRTMAELAAPEPEPDPVFVLESPPHDLPISPQEHQALEGAINEYAELFGREPKIVRENVKKKMALEIGCPSFLDLTPTQFATVMQWLLLPLAEKGKL